MHRPCDVDTASALALLQEEKFNKVRPRTFGKDGIKVAFRNFADKQKGAEIEKPRQVQVRGDKEDKLATLRDFRRKNGLCFKYGGKWGANHKCPDQIPLHVLEELLDALDEDDSGDCELEQEEVEDVVLAVGHSQEAPSVRRRTLKICGQVGKMDVLILVDLGSVGTFISDQLAAKLKVETVECSPAHFVADDGSPMVCSQKVLHLPWSAQGYSFTSTVGILPLRCFDMILGQDWLEECSPMWIHWAKNIMKFTKNGRRICLQGLQQDLSKCMALSPTGMKGLLRK